MFIHFTRNETCVNSLSKLEGGIYDQGQTLVYVGPQGLLEASEESMGVKYELKG